MKTDEINADSLYKISEERLNKVRVEKLQVILKHCLEAAGKGFKSTSYVAEELAPQSYTYIVNKLEQLGFKCTSKQCTESNKKLLIIDWSKK